MFKDILDFFLHLWSPKTTLENDEDIDPLVCISGNKLSDNYKNVVKLLELYDIKHQTSENDTSCITLTIDNDLELTNIHTIYVLIGRLSRTLPHRDYKSAMIIHSYLDEFNKIELLLDLDNTDMCHDKKILVMSFLKRMNQELENSTYLGHFDSTTIADFTLYFLLCKILVKMDLIIEELPCVFDHFYDMDVWLNFEIDSETKDD